MAESITLARPYARAAYERAQDDGDLEDWARMLRLAASVTRADGVEAVLSSPAWTGAQRAQALIDLCGEELNDYAGNFLRILAENKRLSLLPDISSLFEAMKASQERQAEVEIISAFPLQERVQIKLAKALEKRLQRRINLVCRVDGNLIGGIVIRTGDLVIDDSVRGKLAKMAATAGA